MKTKGKKTVYRMIPMMEEIYGRTSTNNAKGAYLVVGFYFLLHGFIYISQISIVINFTNRKGKLSLKVKVSK